MRVRPNQNPGIPASASESEAKITEGTSNTIMFAESSKAKTPFENDSFESTFRGEAKGMHAEFIFDTVKSPKDQASGQFMDYTDDSCEKKADNNVSQKYTMFLPE